MEDYEDEFGDQRCSECGTLENVILEYAICNSCLKHLENKTGYCSIECRVSGECDGSC